MNRVMPSAQARSPIDFRIAGCLSQPPIPVKDSAPTIELPFKWAIEDTNFGESKNG